MQITHPTCCAQMARGRPFSATRRPQPVRLRWTPREHHPANEANYVREPRVLRERSALTPCRGTMKTGAVSSSTGCTYEHFLPSTPGPWARQIWTRDENQNKTLVADFVAGVDTWCLEVPGAAPDARLLFALDLSCF